MGLGSAVWLVAVVFCGLHLGQREISLMRCEISLSVFINCGIILFHMWHSFFEDDFSGYLYSMLFPSIKKLCIYEEIHLRNKTPLLVSNLVHLLHLFSYSANLLKYTIYFSVRCPPYGSRLINGFWKYLTVLVSIVEWQFKLASS